MIAESLLIGLIAGMIFYELFDISPGGVVTPGYFALFLDKPLRIVSTIILAMIVWGIVEILSRYLVLYGKRKFYLALLLGFLLKILLEQYFMPGMEIDAGLMSIGYIIPGLIANEMTRQKPLNTILGLGIVSVFVSFVLLLIR